MRGRLLAAASASARLRALGMPRPSFMENYSDADKNIVCAIKAHK
jgi:hypothetical protein